MNKKSLGGGALTAGTCSGRGIPVWRARGPRASSRRRRGPGLQRALIVSPVGFAHLYHSGRRRGGGRGRAERGLPLRSMKPITRPVRPPTRPSALERPLAAPTMAGPAADVTRDRPCAALDAVVLAVSAALAVDVDSQRRAANRKAGCRISGRRTAAARDMVGGRDGETLSVGGQLSRCGGPGASWRLVFFL